MNELALFAGAGGGILGGSLLGWKTVCAVENDPYAASVLVARQNDGLLPPFPIWDDVCTFDGTAWRGIVDVVSGGFPCQDISAAGRGEGIEGSRSGLWVEMARIISEVGPRYAFVENSPILTSRGLGVVLGDLASLGYDARWGVLGAADVGAPHLRERIWIVAHSRHQEHGQERCCI
jgi:DNA (cytosine-5)-methyltransferase 1